MSKVNDKLRKYQKRRNKKLLLILVILFLVFITFYQGFIAASPTNVVILFLSVCVIILIYIRFKRPDWLDLSMQAIITVDCDADLWLAYLSLTKQNKKVYDKIKYSAALNYVGQVDEAFKMLKTCDPQRIRVIEHYLSYILVMNDTCFYLNDLTRLEQLAKIIASEKNNDMKIRRQLNYLKEVNRYYISCLKEESPDIDGIRALISSAVTMIERVKLTYLLYLTTRSAGKRTVNEEAVAFILTNGGTTFFVAKTENSTVEERKEARS